LVKYPLRRADALLAVSSHTAGRVERLAGRPVRVVGAGVDPAFAPGAVPAAAVVGCVSRFVPRKGQRRVLTAVARLREEGREVSALLVGSGRDEARLRRLADRLGVPTRFEVAVPYSRLPSLYREMSVFAMPCRSRWLGLEIEGLGVVYLEAAATGLPVVTGGSGGAPETIDPGVTGFVVDRDGALLDALRRLVDDPVLASSMGRSGRKWISERFTWDAAAARFEAGLREAASG
jgi:phosphatidylinositol alpha-1,6-mannosyltransferase